MLKGLKKVKTLKDKIFAYALENAIAHEGKTRIDVVLSKLFQEGLRKEDIKKVLPAIKKIVDYANRLSKEKQEKEFEKLQGIIKKKVRKEEFAGLPKAKKGAVMLRFEPSPTGPLHIGHALTLLLNYIYKLLYNGKLILRFADTNPGQIDKKAYEMITEDAKWLTNNGIDSIIYQSDRLKIYYDYAVRIMKKGEAYVCTCKPEYFRQLVNASKPCPCRNLQLEEQLKRWKKMFSDYKEGQAVLRIKTDLKAKNPAVREWPAFRICKARHPRNIKQRVWPLMNFAVAIDDAKQSITHVIRGKDHVVNTERQLYIYHYLNFREPVFIHIGRINFKGIKLSTRKTADAIKNKQYSGWDDIRLPFIQAFRKRGLQAEALKKFTENTGLSKVDKTVDYDEFMLMIYAFNKPFIESSNRYFFVREPVKITIENAPKLKASIPLHPQDPKRGSRKFETGQQFYITKGDLKEIKSNKICRLINLLNFSKKGNKFVFHSIEHKPDLKAKLIHWLPCQENFVKAKVLMLDGGYVKGLAEAGIAKLKEGVIVQFERFGFCKLIKKNKEYEFWFTQK